MNRFYSIKSLLLLLPPQTLESSARPTAVSAWERDANKPMMDKIAVMSELFGVPVTHFFDVGENPISIVSEPSNIYKVSPRTVRIPVLGEIACGDPILVEENYENYRDELVESLPAGNLV